MTQQVIQLPYTAEELKSLLARVNNYEMEWTSITGTTQVAFIASAEANEEYDVDVSSVIPQDGYLYEVIGHFDADLGKSYVGILMQKPDGTFEYSGSCVKTPDVSNSCAMGIVRTIVSDTLRVHCWGASQNIRINLHAYRRAGKIQTES